MMERIIKSSKGFTLVELLVGVAVLGILMAGILGILSSSLLSFRYDFAQTHDVQEARRTINYIADELRYANKIDLTTLGTVNTVKYDTIVNGITVTRTIARDSGTKTITVSGTGLPTVQFGSGIADALTFTRSDFTTEDRIQVRISLTMNDTSFIGGRVMTLTNDIVPTNIKLSQAATKIVSY